MHHVLRFDPSEENAYMRFRRSAWKFSVNRGFTYFHDSVECTFMCFALCFIHGTQVYERIEFNCAWTCLDSDIWILCDLKNHGLLVPILLIVGTFDHVDCQPRLRSLSINLRREWYSNCASHYYLVVCRIRAFPGANRNKVFRYNGKSYWLNLPKNGSCLPYFWSKKFFSQTC